jgi:Bacterial PH domain
VPAGLIAWKLGALAVLVLLALAGRDPTQRGVAGLVGLAVAGFLGRDLLARERLRADASGLVLVRGYAGRRRLSWAEVERVRVDERFRLGAQVRMLEIDAGTDIYLFSRYDLGVDPAEVAIVLAPLRPEPPEPEPPEPEPPAAGRPSGGD